LIQQHKLTGAEQDEMTNAFESLADIYSNLEDLKESSCSSLASTEVKAKITLMMETIDDITEELENDRNNI